MENSSKALIIAGAILIAILLISVGIMVMNSVNKPIDQVASEANSQDAQMYNAKFVNYAGKDKSAAQIRKLINDGLANMGANPNNFVCIALCLKSENKWRIGNYKASFEADGKAILKNDCTFQSLKEILPESSKYKVSFQYNSTGYIDIVKIEEQ